MDVTTTKILIIFGLLISTLLAALLPLICIRYTAQRRRRRRRMTNASDGGRVSTWRDVFFCCDEKGAKTPLADNSAPLRQDSTKARKSRAKVAISALNCFAGGIFLATSFLGLLPEIRESFETFQIAWPKRNPSPPVNITSDEGEEEVALMPIAEIVITCGLFLILSIEQGAHGLNHWRQRRKALRRSERPLEVEAGEQLEMSERQRSRTDQEASHSKVDDHHDHGSEADTPSHNHSAIRSLMLVATLSVHSLLEGIAVGLQEDTGSVLAIFVAVLFHKCLMAFSMGTNLVRSKQAVKRIVAAALIFAFMSPVGIAVGIIIKVTGGDDSGTVLVNAILQAIATGTFLYITFFEVLVREFETSGNRLIKVVSLLVGYGAVLGTIFAQHM